MTQKYGQPIQAEQENRGKSSQMKKQKDLIETKLEKRKFVMKKMRKLTSFRTASQIC